MQYQIFISYRRDGGESLAALLHERFIRMGYRVFYDVESLRSGNFNEKLLEVITECDDVLLVLPPGGLDRCLNDENDWVRREIEHALKCGKNIVPIMMRNFEFPAHLPESLKPLVNKNGVSANMEYFDAVVEKIAKQRLKCTPDKNADKDEKKIEELKISAGKGSAKAMNELGIMYEKGSVTLVPNMKKAFRYYIDAWEQGCLAAAYNLGDVYERCASDLTLVREYGFSPERAAASDYKLELTEQAMRYYEAAAGEGYAPALYKLGNKKEEERQLEQAYTYYEQAAEQKYLPAVNAQAWMLRNGLGTGQDLQKAEALYKEAAEAGYPAAVYNYASMIETRDPEKAMNLYSQVAYGEQALPIAMYALGRRYEFGLRDFRNAIACYERAVKYGINEAADDLERCKNTLI